MTSGELVTLEKRGLATVHTDSSPRRQMHGEANHKFGDILQRVPYVLVTRIVSCGVLFIITQATSSRRETCWNFPWSPSIMQLPSWLLAIRLNFNMVSIRYPIMRDLAIQTSLLRFAIWRPVRSVAGAGKRKYVLWWYANLRWATEASDKENSLTDSSSEHF